MHKRYYNFIRFNLRFNLRFIYKRVDFAIELLLNSNNEVFFILIILRM